MSGARPLAPRSGSSEVDRERPGPGKQWVEIPGPVPAGWVQLDYRAIAEVPLSISLSMNRDESAAEQDGIRLDAVPSKTSGRQRAFLFLPESVRSLRLTAGGATEAIAFTDVSLRPLGPWALKWRLAVNYLRHRGSIATTLRHLSIQAWVVVRWQGLRNVPRLVKVHLLKHERMVHVTYDSWIARQQRPRGDSETMLRAMAAWSRSPLISVLVTGSEDDRDHLRRSLISLRSQTYPHWQLCLATSPDGIEAVKGELAAADRTGEARPRCAPMAPHGSSDAFLAGALDLASGEYLVCMEAGDQLAPDAFHQVARVINQNPSAVMIYSDHDHIDGSGRRTAPVFKPDWSPDTFLSWFYTGNLGVYRSRSVRAVGGFRPGRAALYDMLLRLVDHCQEIYHIPSILFHRFEPRRVWSGDSEKELDAYRRCLQQALARRGEKALVEPIIGLRNKFLIRHDLRETPLISIIIPTRDGAALLNRCLDSIFTRSSYRRFEVLLIDNGSRQAATSRCYRHWKNVAADRLAIHPLPIPFNFSTLINHGVRRARGDLILLLNNDVEVLSPDWLEQMAAQALRPRVGAVGAKLLYPDGLIQHAGVVLGIGWVAGHAHRNCPGNAKGYLDRLMTVNNCAAVTGACLMVGRDRFYRVGGFDQQLSITFNDVDFCLKLLRRGLVNVWLPQVQLIHHESKSRGEDDSWPKLNRFYREVDLMNKRWPELLANDPYYNPNLTRFREDFSLMPEVLP